MTKLISWLTVSLCLCVLTGCEWTAGSGVTSWDDSGNWVDFSGTYKSSSGPNNILVTQFGVTNTTTTTNTTYSTNTITGEYLATGNGTNTAFQGQLAYTPVRGSLTIFTIGGYHFTDTAGTTADTVSLNVTPADGSAGTFNYSTRAWALTFPAPLAAGTVIQATYQYSGSATSTNIVSYQGNHGSPIYSFVVYQTGNNIQITDSNGSTYQGTMGTVRTTAGLEVDATSTEFIMPQTGPVTAQFSASGVSQGYNVTIVGTLQGTLTGSGTSVILSGRTMQATFIEQGGNEANISAVAQQ